MDDILGGPGFVRTKLAVQQAKAALAEVFGVLRLDSVCLKNTSKQQTYLERCLHLGRTRAGDDACTAVALGSFLRSLIYREPFLFGKAFLHLWFKLKHSWEARSLCTFSLQLFSFLVSLLGDHYHALAQRMIETKEILLAAWAGWYGQNAPKSWGWEGLEHGRCCSVWTWCSFKSFGSLYLQPATSATGGDVESVRGMWVLYWNGSRTWSQKAC